MNSVTSVLPQTRFPRIERLPPYVFNIVGDLKKAARARGEDIIDFGMGNPDQPTPKHIVDKLVEVATRGTESDYVKPEHHREEGVHTHRYSVSRGIPRLRRAMARWYKSRYDVDVDPDREVIATIGSKEGLAHLAFATLAPGDTVLVPNPAYPIHIFGTVLAGADVRYVRIGEGIDFFAELVKAIKGTVPTPKMLILNFPANPTTQCVELDFFEKIVAICKEHGIWLVHDLAYADLCFDGYKAPSVLQVPGAKDIAVEFFTLSKSYNMPGWRVGFMCGNPQLVGALTRIKSYLDYGMFTPIQVAAIAALEGPQDCVAEICDLYRKRRDVLCEGLTHAGWPVEKPKATMFVWAKIPEAFRHLGSLEFSRRLLAEAKVAVSPGVGFGDYGDDSVRFALIENEQRTRQAVRSIKKMLANGPGAA
ncbi:MAG: alanine transaminase [Nevskiaceae bacterium]|nr:MAG: alanine transaminase [Nevskiaceae bacterium]TBR74718.1 MAG: alanine transaminase [Nevskiaceae bacterium]